MPPVFSWQTILALITETIRTQKGLSRKIKPTENLGVDLEIHPSAVFEQINLDLEPQGYGLSEADIKAFTDAGGVTVMSLAMYVAAHLESKGFKIVRSITRRRIRDIIGTEIERCTGRETDLIEDSNILQTEVGYDAADLFQQIRPLIETECGVQLADLNVSVVISTDTVLRFIDAVADLLRSRGVAVIE